MIMSRFEKISCKVADKVGIDGRRGSEWKMYRIWKEEMAYFLVLFLFLFLGEDIWAIGLILDG